MKETGFSAKKDEIVYLPDDKGKIAFVLIGKNLDFRETGALIKSLTVRKYSIVNPLSQKEYMKAMLNNKEDLSKDPRIKISTIHGAKGGEATNVVLFLNQTTNTIKGAKKSQAKQDEEFRVWYVGTTRTMQNLFVIKCKNKSKEFKL